LDHASDKAGDVAPSGDQRGATALMEMR